MRAYDTACACACACACAHRVEWVEEWIGSGLSAGGNIRRSGFDDIQALILDHRGYPMV